MLGGGGGGGGGCSLFCFVFVWVFFLRRGRGNIGQGGIERDREDEVMQTDKWADAKKRIRDR